MIAIAKMTLDIAACVFSGLVKIMPSRVIAKFLFNGRTR